MPELLLSLFITQFCDNRIFGLIFAWVLTVVCPKNGQPGLDV